MENKETFEFEGKVSKIVPKEKNHFVHLEDKRMVSGWGSCPDDLVEGELYLFSGKKNGEFFNYDKYEKRTEKNKEIPVEEIEDKSTKTEESMKKVHQHQKRIITNSEGQAFGLACNLSLRKTLKEVAEVLEPASTLDSKFWDKYRENVKKFYAENDKLREEVLG